MRPVLKGCFVAAGLLLVVAGLAIAVVGPGAVRQGKRFALPVLAIVGEAQRFDEFVEKSPWRAPAVEGITAEQLDRFLALRARLDVLYARFAPGLAEVHSQEPENIDDAAQAVQLFGDLVPEQMKAFMESQMTPREYRYVDALVYGRWRRGLKAQGSLPSVREVAARELEAAAAMEADPSVAARLRELGAELRTRPAAPPEGVPAELHELLLPRIEEIERLSLEAYGNLPLPEL